MRRENRTNNLENTCGLDDTDDEENAGELGESGGMRARTTTQEAFDAGS